MLPDSMRLKNGMIDSTGTTLSQNRFRGAVKVLAGLIGYLGAALGLPGK